MTMPRAFRTVATTAIDVGVLSVAYIAAFFIRFDGAPPLQMFKRLMFTWPYVLGLELLVLYAFAVPYFAWRYVGLREAQRVFAATATTTLVLFGVRCAAIALIPIVDHFEYALVPLGVIAVNAVLAFLGILGVRFARRVMTERSNTNNLRKKKATFVPTLLIGAGQAGVLIVREIALRPDIAIRPVGFLDDDFGKLGTIVHGVRVLGTIAEVAEVARLTGAEQVIITIANADGAQLRKIMRSCEGAGIPVKLIPGLYEILDGTVNLSRLRDVSIEDLLGREAVTLDLDLIKGFIQDKTVLITGAGGSIGSELCRQVARFKPAALLLVEQSEFNLFTIHQELIAAVPGLDIRPLICNVCDSARVDKIFATGLPHVVFHAAAHKHVPMMEWNPGEAVKNNVFGTKKVADAADRHGCEAFVLVSTDKAVNPTSVMGATKRAAEIYIQALSQTSKTKYLAVRFGNVLGSAGSVVPIFKAQIAAGGPVTVTHPEMRRYFLTIPEASQLVMQAAAMGKGGEIFVLDMGEPVRIASLAEELIRLTGLEPGVDIEIVYSGVRLGEKLFEELAFDAERMSKTRHGKIFVGKLRPSEMSEVVASFEHLARVTDSSDRPAVRSALGQVVVEMRESDEQVAPVSSGEVWLSPAFGERSRLDEVG